MVYISCRFLFCCPLSLSLYCHRLLYQRIYFLLHRFSIYLFIYLFLYLSFHLDLPPLFVPLVIGVLLKVSNVNISSSDVDIRLLYLFLCPFYFLSYSFFLFRMFVPSGFSYPTLFLYSFYLFYWVWHLLLLNATFLPDGVNGALNSTTRKMTDLFIFRGPIVVPVGWVP